MHRYIGLDVHAQSSTMVILTGVSGRRSSQVLETSARTLISALRALSGTLHLCLEEGAQSQWLYEVLHPHVDELVVVQPEAPKGTKSDESDALRLAQMMRTRSWPKRVVKAPKRLSLLRAAVQNHGTATQDLVRAKNRLKAVCRARGLMVDDAIYDPKARAALLNRLPNAARILGVGLAVRLDAATVIRNRAQEWLEEEASKLPEVARLATAPGIGVVRAAQIVAIVMEPTRFRTKRQLWSYAGLGVVTHASSEWERGPRGERWQRRPKKVQTRGLNRNRNPVLKAAFKGAAQTVIGMHDHPLAVAYRAQLAQGTSDSSALLTVARRIAAAVLALWKSKETYDVNRQRTQTAA
jgi:transposase